MLMETKTQYWYPPPGNNEHTRNSKRVYKMVISARWTFWEWIKDTTGIHILLERNCLVERNCLLALQGFLFACKSSKILVFFFLLDGKKPFFFFQSASLLWSLTENKDMFASIQCKRHTWGWIVRNEILLIFASG